MASLHFTPLILTHVAAAFAAVAAGAAMLAMEKGTRAHRLLGRAWVMLMAVTALVSFGIRSTGHFSWIHLLSIGALFSVGWAIRAAVRGDIRRHRRVMQFTYMGLLIAGLFALMPARRFGDLVWHIAALA
jgi:uncharacterized membrane protein